jgi:hypothetical protein
MKPVYNRKAAKIQIFKLKASNIICRLGLIKVDFDNIHNRQFSIQKYIKLIKQEDHDGPEIAHLYIGPWANANFKPGAFS